MPATAAEDCEALCAYVMKFGMGSGVLPHWAKCYDAANSLNDDVVATGYNSLIPPATRRMLNESECLRELLVRY